MLLKKQDHLGAGSSKESNRALLNWDAFPFSLSLVPTTRGLILLDGTSPQTYQPAPESCELSLTLWRLWD